MPVPHPFRFGMLHRSDILACYVARSALTTEILAKVPLRIPDPAEAPATFDHVIVLDKLQ